jgi:uncharacterized membrane protein YdcZ (DUF606 family)
VTKGIALLLSAAAGMLVAMQPPINSKLGGVVGTFAAATISFLVGTAALFVVAVASGGTHLEGTLGAGGVVAATIAGQLGGSVVIDQFGRLGLDRQPLTVRWWSGSCCWRPACS